MISGGSKREEREKRGELERERRPRNAPLSVSLSSLSRKKKRPKKKPKKTHGLDLRAVLCRELVDERRDHPAGAAPGRPEVDEHGHGRLEDVLLPGGVGDGA